jgi:DNA repair protein RadC
MSMLYINDSGEFRPANDEQVLKSAELRLSKRFRVGSPVLGNAAASRDYLRAHLAPLDYEVFGCLYMDSRNRLIAREDLFRGTIDGASVAVREVIRRVILHGAVGLVLYHNHPSGVAEPSQADELVTTRIRHAAALIDVRVLDHLIIGESVYSFSEHGLI